MANNSKCSQYFLFDVIFGAIIYDDSVIRTFYQSLRFGQLFMTFWTFMPFCSLTYGNFPFVSAMMTFPICTIARPC